MAQAVIAAAHQINGRKTRYRIQSCFFVLISASQILFFLAWLFLLDVPVLLSYERKPLPGISERLLPLSHRFLFLPDTVL